MHDKGFKSTTEPLHVKCILFDLDGTIFDTADAIRRAVEETKVAFNLTIDVDHVINESLNVLEGRKSKLNFLIIAFHFNFFSWKDPLRIFQIKQFFEDRFRAYTREGVLFPGVIDCLHGLSAYRLAVVTSRERAWAEDSLRKHDLLHLFEVMITTDDVKKDKPHPAPLQRALTLLKVDPSDCLYVGDLPSDIRAGKRTGVRTAAILTGLSPRSRLEKEHPDYIFEDLEELMETFIHE
ncbi:MAG: HAD family hydrolase [Theionarchaea archaeon]|nr:HAD family hydrolase [Theionarchaea archaeon]